MAGTAEWVGDHLGDVATEVVKMGHFEKFGYEKEGEGNKWGGNWLISFLFCFVFNEGRQNGEAAVEDLEERREGSLTG